MKHTALFIALFASVACSTNLLASTSESQGEQSYFSNKKDVLAELKETSVEIWVDRYLQSFSGFWATFKWKDIGNNTVSLWPVSGGKFIDPWSIPEKIRASTDYTVTVRDENYKVKSDREFTYNTPLNEIADYLTKQNLRLGKDSIQIIYTASNDHVRIGGKVESFNNINFSEPTKWQINNYAFSPRENGLRAFYINQDRIDNNLYLIGNGFAFLAVDSTYPGNVFLDAVTSRYTEWQVTYDEDKLAYRIKMSAPGYENKNVAWTPSRGSNVFVYTQLDSADQYWLFKKSESINQYEIISAADVTKYLNVDADKRNVRVANQTHDYDQLFSLEPINTDGN